VLNKLGGNETIDLPSGIVVQRSDGIDPCLDCFTCTIELVGLVEGGSLNAPAAVMPHDDNVADLECRHTVRDRGDGVEVFVGILVCDVTFGEEDTRGRGEDGSFGNSGVTG